jgi:hypothetical protein
LIGGLGLGSGDRFILSGDFQGGAGGGETALGVRLLGGEGGLDVGNELATGSFGEFDGVIRVLVGGDIG